MQGNEHRRQRQVRVRGGLIVAETPSPKKAVWVKIHETRDQGRSQRRYRLFLDEESTSIILEVDTLGGDSSTSVWITDGTKRGYDLEDEDFDGEGAKYAKAYWASQEGLDRIETSIREQIVGEIMGAYDRLRTGTWLQDHLRPFGDAFFHGPDLGGVIGAVGLLSGRTALPDLRCPICQGPAKMGPFGPGDAIGLICVACKTHFKQCSCDVQEASP